MASPFRHIVVLMMENRSFDHMLGYLKAADYAIDGLDGDETNPSPDEGPSVRVSPDARNIGDLTPDPQHEFVHVNTQIFGNPQGTDTGQEMMQGFVDDYTDVSGDAVLGRNIMKCFHAESLPTLSTLAKNYAVCDRWFSSVPGSTIPNRLFAHAATSGGSLTQDAVIAPATAKTIFEVIDDPNNPATYRIYTDGATILMANLYLARHQKGFYDYRSRFRQDCKDGLLPEYTFIEPSYDDDIAHGILARSQHPDFAVDAGDALIAEVYTAIRQSPHWNETLLLILYDEHGGLFDHVPPPTFKLPPNPDIPFSKDFAFPFNRLGVRVPAVFVSPRIKPGTILHQEFDHCSIVATVRKLFCLNKTPFSWREARAIPFDDIANLSDAEIRTDTVVFPAAGAPMARDVVLSDADRAAANATMAATGSPATPHAADANFIGATAPAVAVPAKPTDLTLLMAQSMQHTLAILNLTTQRKMDQIVTAQDAADYLREATNALQKVRTA